MFIILWLLCSYMPAYSQLSLTVRTSLPPEGAKTLVWPVQLGLLKNFTKAWNCSKYQSSQSDYIQAIGPIRVLFLCSSLSLKAIHRIKSLNFIQGLVNSKVLLRYICKNNELTHYMCNIDLDEDYLVNCTHETGQLLCFGSAEQRARKYTPPGSVMVI